MSWGAVIGGAVSLIGGGLAANSASDDRAMAQSQIDRLNQISFSPTSLTGPGGLGVTFTPEGPRRGLGARTPASTSFQLGDFEGLFQGFRDTADQGIQQGTSIQNMSNLALPGLMRGVGQAGMLADSSFGRAAGLSGGFQRGLQDMLFGGAGRNAQSLSGGFDNVRDDTLALLREQAQPFEQRAFSNFQDKLFSQGIMGSTGGALQTEAFARGLGQNDLQRQLAAGQEARQTQGATLAALQGQLGGGSGLAGLENSLIQDAFGRFSGTMGLASDLSGSIFNRGTGMFNQGIQGLAGTQSIQQMLMQLGQFSANLEAQRSNTELGAAGQSMQGIQNLGMSGNDIMAGFLGSLGNNLMSTNLGGRSTPASSTGGYRGVGGAGSVYGQNQSPTDVFGNFSINDIPPGG